MSRSVYRVPSAVFISVTVLPFTRVTVAAPFSNEPPTETVPALPLTEIVACLTFTEIGFDPPVTTRLDGALPEPGFWVEAGFDEAGVVLEPDRKSTRLNSSHPSISY